MTTRNRIYRGIITDDGQAVYAMELDTGHRPTAELDHLKRRPDLIGRAPVSFAWGQGEMRCSHLALAMLADAIGDDRLAVALMLPFSGLVVSRIPADEPWIMSSNVVRAIAAHIAGERAAA